MSNYSELSRPTRAWLRVCSRARARCLHRPNDLDVDICSELIWRRTMKHISSSIVLGAALVLLSINQSFAEPIHTEIQSRLFRLGYQIDVDGLWGDAARQSAAEDRSILL